MQIYIYVCDVTSAYMLDLYSSRAGIPAQWRYVCKDPYNVTCCIIYIAIYLYFNSKEKHGYSDWRVNKHVGSINPDGDDWLYARMKV